MHASETLRPSRALRIVALLLISAVPASAQDAKYAPEELHRHFQNEAEAYSMQMGDTELALRRQPLMYWQNPERNHELGSTYIWEQHGIPQILVSIFTFEYNNVVRCRHEMISLADRGFQCSLHNEPVWSPNRSGMEWKSIEDTQPANSAPRRLFQMRTLARQFSATINYAGKRPQVLTLIPQPLIRYASPDQGVIDGAIFSLAIVTDPELLLVIEARRTTSGEAEFRYAPVRSNYNALELKRNDEPVWSKPLVIELQGTRAGQLPFANDPFFVFTPSRPLPEPGTIP